MSYVRVCSICGSRDLGLPRKIESMPGFSVNERCYCNNCGNESVPILIDTEATQEKSTDNDTFQTINLIPIDTTNYRDRPMVSRIRWDQRLKSDEEIETFAAHKQKLLEIDSRLNLMVLDLGGINYAQPNYRILKEVVKPKYQTYLDPGIHDIADIFDAFTMDAWKVVCNSSCTKSLKIFEEAFELSDHVLPCLHVQSRNVVWKSSREENDVSRIIRQLEKIGFEEFCIINVDRLGKSADYEHIRYIANMHSNILYGGGVSYEDLPNMKDRGFAGAIIEEYFVKTN